MASRALTIKWLRGLAEEGGKGVVNNIDARCLGRIADDLEQMEKALEEIAGTRDIPSSIPISTARAVLAADVGGVSK